MDWFAFGLPREGGPAQARALDVMAEDVPTCGPHERLAAIGPRVRAQGWDTCVVVDQERVVLGLLGPPALEGDPRAEAAQVMECAPSTYRPYAAPGSILQQLARRRAGSALVTTSDGKLLGLLRRADLERAVRAARSPAERRGLHEE